MREVQVEVMYISRCETINQNVMLLSVKDKQEINTQEEEVTAEEEVTTEEEVLVQTFEEKECDEPTSDSSIGTSLESSEVSLGLLYHPCHGGQAYYL
jgi:hypothetical protein